MAAVTICSDFGAPKIKVYHCFDCFLIYFYYYYYFFFALRCERLVKRKFGGRIRNSVFGNVKYKILIKKAAGYVNLELEGTVQDGKTFAYMWYLKTKQWAC